MKFAYQRGGQPIIQWASPSAPHQSRAADTVALGSLGGSTLAGSTLPAPGAPEPILSGLGGCSCSGSCGCGSSSPAAALSGVFDDPGNVIMFGLLGYCLVRYLANGNTNMFSLAWRPRRR